MGSRSDLEDAFAAHQARAYRYFVRMVGAREIARDLTQETMVRAFSHASRYRGEAPVDAWILGIARNVFFEWIRKTSRDLSVERSERDADPAQGPDPDGIDVERALARLDPEHREVLVLRFSLDLSGEEVARLLGISHGPFVNASRGPRMPSGRSGRSHD